MLLFITHLTVKMLSHCERKTSQPRGCGVQKNYVLASWIPEGVIWLRVNRRTKARFLLQTMPENRRARCLLIVVCVFRDIVWRNLPPSNSPVWFILLINTLLNIDSIASTPFRSFSLYARPWTSTDKRHRGLINLYHHSTVVLRDEK